MLPLHSAGERKEGDEHAGGGVRRWEGRSWGGALERGGRHSVEAQGLIAVRNVVAVGGLRVLFSVK